MPTRILFLSFSAFLMALGLVLPRPVAAQERLPLYTQSFNADLEEGTPTFELVDAFGRLHNENINSESDLGTLSSDLIKIYYIDALGVHFTGLGYPEYEDLLDRESAFYHSGPPEGGVGWHEVDGVHLRWEPDYRFVAARADVGDPTAAAATISGYWVHRLEDDGSMTTIGQAINGATSLVDTTADPSVENRYLVTTWDLGGYQYPLSQEGAPIVVPPVSEPELPVFWPADKAYVETSLADRIRSSFSGGWMWVRTEVSIRTSSSWR